MTPEEQKQVDEIMRRNATDVKGKPRSSAELAKIREWAEKVAKPGR